MNYIKKSCCLGLLSLITLLGILFVFDNKAEFPLNQDFYSQVIVNQNVNLVFYKNNCPYCRAAKKEVVETSKKNDFPTFFIDLDTEEGQIIKMKYGVRYAATIVSIRSGNAESFLYAKKERDKFIPDRLAIRQAFSVGQGEEHEKK